MVFRKSSSADSDYWLKQPKRDEGEQFAVVTLQTGAEYIKVLCEDGIERPARIIGKLRHKVFIKENDVVIIRKQEYNDNKMDVVWRFLPLHVAKLKMQGHLGKLPI